MRGLLAAVIVMGVLIVIGVATLAVTVVGRLTVPPPHAPNVAILDEPAGTRMQSITSAGDQLAVLLTGGGPDRIVVLNAHTGRVTSRMALGQ